MPVNIEKNASELKISPEVYRRILTSAILQAEEDIPKIESALSQGDIPTIQTISHRWKGDFANLRLELLSRRAKELNDAAKTSKELGLLRDLFAEFYMDFQKLKTALT